MGQMRKFLRTTLDQLQCERRHPEFIPPRAVFSCFILRNVAREIEAQQSEAIAVGVSLCAAPFRLDITCALMCIQRSSMLIASHRAAI